jgi:aspartate aminotransferase
VRARLPDGLARWIEPQEQFEAIRRDAVRHHARVCDLAYANVHDGAAGIAVEAMRAALDRAGPLDLQYTPYGGATVTRRLVADQLRGRYACEFDWRDVVLTPGAMAALNVLLQSVRLDGAAGNEIVLVAPCWMDYPLYVAQLRMTPILVPVRPDLHLDLDRLRAAVGPRTRAVVLSQPANPTGVVYDAGELDALARLLLEAPDPPLLISDECHRDVHRPGLQVPSAIASYPNTAVVYSFGKLFGIQGQRIGYIAISPRMTGRRDMASVCAQLCRVMGYCTPTALMQIAVRALLGRTPDLSAIDRRRTRVVAALRQAGLSVVPPDATFFVYPRTPASDEITFVRLLASRGVLVLPASMFHHTGHIRLSLTATDAMIDEAIARIVDAAAQAA